MAKLIGYTMDPKGIKMICESTGSDSAVGAMDAQTAINTRFGMKPDENVTEMMEHLKGYGNQEFADKLMEGLTTRRFRSMDSLAEEISNRHMALRFQQVYDYLMEEFGEVGSSAMMDTSTWHRGGDQSKKIRPEDDPNVSPTELFDMQDADPNNQISYIWMLTPGGVPINITLKNPKFPKNYKASKEFAAKLQKQYIENGDSKTIFGVSPKFENITSPKELELTQYSKAIRSSLKESKLIEQIIKSLNDGEVLAAEICLEESENTYFMSDDEIMGRAMASKWVGLKDARKLRGIIMMEILEAMKSFGDKTLGAGDEFSLAGAYRGERALSDPDLKVGDTINPKTMKGSEPWVVWVIYKDIDKGGELSFIRSSVGAVSRQVATETADMINGRDSGIYRNVVAMELPLGQDPDRKAMQRQQVEEAADRLEPIKKPNNLFEALAKLETIYRFLLAEGIKAQVKPDGVKSFLTEQLKK
jgi:hypothetical protein